MSNPNEDKVYFYPEQLKYLEKIFPSTVFPPQVQEEVLRHYNGQQDVIQFIRSKTRR